jgi:hypothetical protein
VQGTWGSSVCLQGWALGGGLSQGHCGVSAVYTSAAVSVCGQKPSGWLCRPSGLQCKFVQRQTLNTNVVMFCSLSAMVTVRNGCDEWPVPDSVTPAGLPLDCLADPIG